jgi:uncharacterized protein involved in type VI secretion and phage assembly
VREHSEKLALIAGYGKHLLELIDDTPVTPGEARPAYDSYDVSKQIIIDAENALSEWTLDTASVRSKLSVRKPKAKRAVQRGTAAAGGDLSQQDKPLERDTSLWVPASEHEKVLFSINESIFANICRRLKMLTERKSRKSRKRTRKK